jgi:hypothetical protein
MDLSLADVGTTFAGLVPHSCVHCQVIVLDCTNIISKEFSKEFTFTCEEALYAALGGCALFLWCYKARLEKSAGLPPRPSSKLRIDFHSDAWPKVSYAQLDWIEDGESTSDATELGTFHVFTTSGIYSSVRIRYCTV